MNRRRFVSASSLGLAAASFAMLDFGRAKASESQPAIVSTGQAQDPNAIRPLHINVPESELVDLRRRITATRWPDRETVADSSQGVQLATMQLLANYWATEYDWRKVESRLNALPQFVTTIDGLDIHFIHVRSKHENALPVIVTHGWPGSIIEQLKIIDPLTNPTAYGASASDAFHVVIPSIPGYGFSGKPTTTGWSPDRIARAWVVLMKRLGYTQFVAQGGDWGGAIGDVMAAQEPPELLGIHTNFPQTVPAEIGKPLALSAPPPAGLSPDEKRAYEQLINLRAKQLGYAIEMSTRPQTLYAMVDSPVGLAAWMLDHADGYSQPAAGITSAVVGHTVDGHSAGSLTRDDVLDNITLYWVTNTAISSGRLFWENKSRLLGAVNVSIPAAVSVFPGEIYRAPRSWTERAYHKLVYFNDVAAGGHFAAWEQPQLFSEEVRAGFRSFRG